MQTRSWRLSNASGFSMLEALISMFLTLIVMASVFGLLVGGTRTSTVEFDRAEVQAQTRHALNQISRDVMLAGYGLPPEFPAFGRRTAASDGDTSSVMEPIEILGMDSEALHVDPIEVESFDGRTARLRELPPSLALGQPVLVHDDLPIDGSWVLGLVSGIRAEPVFEVELVTGRGMSVTTRSGTVSLPMDLERYNRSSNGPPESGYLTPVNIVRYELEGASRDGIPTLVRQLNWGERIPVAHIETMEIRYFVGGTLVGPVIETGPRRRRRPLKAQSLPSRSARNDVELREPPVPQPNPKLPLDEKNIVRAVRISLTGRSRHANLVGSRVKPSSPADAEGFIRQTLSTRVATRNLISRSELRIMQFEADDAGR